jgi:heat shock protein HtpX
MLVASLLTPLIVAAVVAAVALLAPLKVALGVLIAGALGASFAVAAWRRDEPARSLSREETPELHAVVERLCLLADLPRPRLFLDAERQPNSWVVAPPRRPARLHVTQGLLDALTPDELDAVVAHELAHLANRDAVVMTAVGGPGAVLLDGGRSLINMWPLQAGGALAWLTGAIASVGTNALSRYRELAADAGAAALTGRPAALASALTKVSGGLRAIPQDDLREVTARDAFHLLPVDRPPRWLPRRLGATHPPLERRLAALERLERELHAGRLTADRLLDD